MDNLNTNLALVLTTSRDEYVNDTRVLEKSSQPEDVSSHLTQRINSVFYDKIRDLSFFSEKSTSGELTIFAYKKCELLGKGTFGQVFSVDFVTPPIFDSLSGLVIKEPSEIPRSNEFLKHEYEILKKLHEQGAPGIQSCPHLVTIGGVANNEQVGYFARKFEYDLFALTKYAGKKRINLALNELLQKCENLFLGIQFLFDQGIVHGDIKPNNLCAEKNDQGNIEFKIADFGDARSLTQIREPITILDSFTIDFISEQDFFSALKIEIKSGFATSNMALLYERISPKLEILDRYSSPNPSPYRSLLDDLLIDLTGMPLPDQKALRAEAIGLLKKQDVYALGKTMKEIFEAIDFPTIERRKQFDDLIAAMMEPDYKQRIGIHEALNRYQALLKP